MWQKVAALPEVDLSGRQGRPAPLGLNSFILMQFSVNICWSTNNRLMPSLVELAITFGKILDPSLATFAKKW